MIDVHAPYIQLAVWFPSCCEVAAIIALRLRTLPGSAEIRSLLSLLGLGNTAAERMLGMPVTASFVLGWIIMIAGTTARAATYHELGRHFTYDLMLRKDHKLVTTGPYSIVRHPSYIASITAWTGISICLFGEGSWLSETGMLSKTVWGVVSFIWFANALWYACNFVRRTYLEDDIIREEFKGQWEEWEKQVPYKLVPGVF